MQASLFNIYKIEMIKLIKRKDWLALLALVAISVLFGVSVLSKNYLGESHQSNLYWVCSQIYNSHILFVTPMIFAFIGSRILASEIEDGSILLYTIRFRNRFKIYLGKSLASISFATITFFVAFIINSLIYYIFVCQNPVIGSGKFFGNNTLILIIILFTLYIVSFIFTVQLSLFLSAFFKTVPVIGIVFVINLILNNTFKVPYLRNINPCYYLVRLSNYVMATTNQITINYSQKVVLLSELILTIFIYVIIFNVIAIKKFKNSDLQ